MEAPAVLVDAMTINHSQAALPVKRRRAPQSCERCRKRKTRCEYSDLSTQACLRCLREQKSCEFSTERYKRRASRSKTADGNVMSPSMQDHTTNFHSSIEQQPRTLIGLRQLDMLSPSASQPQHGPDGPVTVPISIQGGDGLSNLGESLPGWDAKRRLISTQLHNATDALDLLTFAATEEEYLDTASRVNMVGSESIRNSNRPEYDRPSIGAEESAATIKNFYLIRSGILSEDEAIEYLRFFFENLWPLKPVIPAYYANPLMYSTLASEEPVLLTTIIALASRYLPLSGHHGAIRSERIHWHTWRSLQKQLQSAMWGSTCTRTLGTIASMLILIDWHPKAINNPSIFADEDSIIGRDEMPKVGKPGTTVNLTNKQRHGMMSLLENLSILSSAYRSNKMSWMLLSNAIALAQEGCCFEAELQGQPSSVSEASSVKKAWNRTICVFIYLTDEHMALRLGLDPLLPEKSRRIVQDRFSKVFASALPNSELWESYFELTDEIRKVRELLHTSKHQISKPNSYDLVAELEYVKRSFDRWKRQHNYPGHDQDSPLNACLSIEFNYAMLYSLSPAPYATDANARHAQQTPSASFRQDAIQAAHDILTLVVDVLEPSGVLRVLPVRCWLFVTTAGLHLLKETILQNPSITEAHQDVKLLRAAVQALHQGSPDDIHTAVRFSRLFGVLLDAVLKPPASRSHVESATHQPNEAQFDPMNPDDLSHMSPDFDMSALPADLEQFCDSTAWWNENFNFRRMV